MDEIKQNEAGGRLSANLNLYDLVDIEILSKNDDTLFGNVLTILISMFSSEIENIKSFSANKQWKQVSEVAHKLKTSLTHIRAISVKQIVRDLEEYDNHSNEDLSKWSTELCNALENMVIHLKIDLENFNKRITT